MLSTKLGKSKLGSAKVIASVIVASVVYLVMLAVLLGVPLAFFGTEGVGLPLQLRELYNANSLSLGAAVLLICVVGYLLRGTVRCWSRVVQTLLQQASGSLISGNALLLRHFLMVRNLSSI